MRKAVICLLLLAVLVVRGGNREVHILAVNDMHAALDAMPQLAAIADSLRTLYPSLLVFSAGDNRTGNPINDMYQPSGYPMVALMNQIGFNASALGNHDFDMHSLPRLMGLSNFRYICANISAADSIGIRTVPCQVFDVEGLRVGVIGVVQTNKRGHPDTHPDNLEGVGFEPAADVVGRYEWMSRECDATILLSHLGYREDTVMASAFPWLDVIIGGHSHTQLKGDTVLAEAQTRMLITQNRNKLPYATHITLTVDSGHVMTKQAEYIDVKNFPQQNHVVKAMVDNFSDHPEFRRVLAHSTAPFANIYEIGCMVCDAMKEESGADVAIQNFRGIRLESHPGGDITVQDVLTMDPFGNFACVMTLTGAELCRMIELYSRKDIFHFPHLAGLHARLTLDKDEPMVIREMKITNEDGSGIDMAKTYRVVTNSYVAAACRAYGFEYTERLNRETSEMIMTFLEKRGTVDYHGVSRIESKVETDTSCVPASK